MNAPDPIIARLVDFREGVKRRNLNPFEYSDKALLGGENVELQQPALMTRRGIKPLGADAAGTQEILAWDFDDEASPPGDLTVSQEITNGSVIATVIDAGGRIAAGNATAAWDDNGYYVCANETGSSDSVYLEIDASDDWYLDTDFSLAIDFYDIVCNRTQGYSEYIDVRLMQGPGWHVDYINGADGCECEYQAVKLVIEADGSDDWEMDAPVSAAWEWNGSQFEAEAGAYPYWRVRVTRVDNSWTLTVRPVSLTGVVDEENGSTQSATHASTFATISSESLKIGRAWVVWWSNGDVPNPCLPDGVDEQDTGLYITNIVFEKTVGLTTPVDDGLIPALKQVRFPSNGASYLVFQTQDQSSGSNGLWCIPDELPVTGEQPTYTALYDLGTNANVVDIAVLNDRCVITDGANNAPIVFPGGLTDDGTDWVKPLLVLVSPDGETHYDVSAAVLDTDSDNTASIGNISQGGYIAILCDVPWVSGFYFAVGVPNTQDEGVLQTRTVEIESIIQVTREDYSGDIVRWVKNTAEGTTKSLAAKAVVDNGGSPNTVNIWCSYHGYSAGQVVWIEGTMNYNGVYVLPTQTHGTAHQIEIESAYTAETITTAATVKIPCQGHFRGEEQNLTAAAVIDNGGSPNTVNIPCIGHGYVAGNIVQIDDTSNYNGTFTLPTQTNGDEDHIEIESAYTAETLDGSETVAQRMTLGTGNDAPWVNVGLEIDMSGSTDAPTIRMITDDGEQDDEVAVNQDTATGTVSGIYGLQVTDRGCHPIIDGTEWTTIFEPGVYTGGLTQNLGQFQDYSFRQVIPAHASQAIGSKVRITIKSGYTLSYNSRWGGYWYVGAGGFLAHAMSIVPRYSGPDGTTDPTPFVANASAFYGTQFYVPPPYADDEVLLEAINFEYDSSLPHLVIADVGNATHYADNFRWPYITNPPSGFHWGGAYGTIVYPTYGDSVAGRNDLDGTYYYKAETDSAETADVAGFTEASGYAIVSKLEIAAGAPITTAAHAGYIGMSMAGVEELHAVAVDQISPSGTYVYHLVSFDYGQTWKIWTGAAWSARAYNDSGTWKYWNGSAFVAAAENTMLRAIVQGSWQQKWTETQLEAVDQSEWHASGGFVPDTTTEILFSFLMTASSDRVPIVQSYTASVVGTDESIIERWHDGAWDSQTWTDGTISGGVSFGKSGVVEYNDSGNYSDSDYGAVDSQPGYWWRFKFEFGTNSSATLDRVLFQAPTQPLQNIGSPSTEACMSFIVYDSSEDSLNDYTEYVSDFTDTSTAPLYYDPDVGDTEPIGNDDAIYIGYAESPFVELNVTMATYGTSSLGALQLYYWDGSSWTEIFATDDTYGFYTNGRIKWTAPDDWEKGRIDVGSYSIGYWIKLVPYTDLSTTTEIAEIRLLPQPPPLVKYNHCAVLQDRLVLGKRSDAPDQVDVSRALEEYGFSGDDSYSLRIGGEDGITGLIAAWNNVMITKPLDAALLTESNGVSATRLEVGHTPVNTKVIVRAPMGGITDSGDVSQQGVFFINTEGAFVYAGLQADQAFGTARSQYLSMDVDWWNDQATYRIDTDNLHIACGAYWAERHWVIWSVPMITDGSTPQTTNNRLLVYDLPLRAWLPPMTATLASLATAWHYNANAVNKLGKQGLYGGGYDGRIYRLFAFDDDFDTTELADEEIDVYAETGWLDFGDSTWYKQLRSLTVFANAEGTDGDITVKVYVDGLTTQDSMSPTFENCQDLSGQEAYFDYTKINIQGRWFKFRLEFTGPTRVYAIVAELGYLRRWPAG